MITKIKNGNIVFPDKVEKANLYFEEGKITNITTKDLPFDAEIDAEGN